MREIMMKALLCSAMAVACASAVNAQCADQWNSPDWTISINGTTQRVFGPFTEAIDANGERSLWAFTYGESARIVIASNSDVGVIEDESHSNGDLNFSLVPVRWNGRAWVAAANSRLFFYGAGPTECTAVLDGGMFVAGKFNGIEVGPGGATQFQRSLSVARFDVQQQRWDAAWSQSHRGVVTEGVGPGTVTDMKTHDGKLYLAGSFTHHIRPETAQGGGKVIINVAMGIASWDPMVWNGGSPIPSSTSPSGTGWSQINFGRNFLDTTFVYFDFFPVNGVDVLHVVGPAIAFVSPTETAPRDVTGSINTDTIVRLVEESGTPSGYWERVDPTGGIFSYGLGALYPTGTVARTVTINGQKLLLARMFSQNYLDGAIIPGALTAWDGADWSFPVNIYGSEPIISDVIVRDSDAHPGDFFVTGGSFGTAQAGSGPAAAVARIVGVDQAGERFDMNLPTVGMGSINGFGINGILGYDSSHAVGRLFISGGINSFQYSTVSTNANLNHPTNIAYWGALLACPGDVNGNFMVDFADLNTLISAYGDATGPDDPNDINGDGTVDFSDLNALLGNFGSNCCQ